jgi:hypothetical protein
MNFCQQRFDCAVALFDAANAQDPNLELADGDTTPKELFYSIRMSEMLLRFAPEAGEAIRLAVRAQHIQRWKIPRSDFPRTTFGYKQWRSRLYKFHAETAGQLMRKAGYDEEVIERVGNSIAKLGIKVNPEAQMLEDVANLVFLEHYLTGFVAQHPEYDEAKWSNILQKTWKKMSPQGRAFALSKIRLPESLTPLITKSLGQ